MADEEKTGTEADAAETTDSKDSEGKPVEAKDRSKELENRLAERGRELKAKETEAAALKAERDALQEERDQLRYEHKMSDAEKEKFRKQRELERQVREDPERANLTNENALLKAIAQEDNAAAKKALNKLYEKASKSGRFPDKNSVQALRESFEADEVESDEAKEKDPPKVRPSGGSAGAAPSIDQRIAEVKAGIKKGRNTTSELLVLMQEKSMAATAARG